MEFTEPFKINSANAGSAVVSLSPHSRYIAVSEFVPPTRRISSVKSELVPAWKVKIVDTETLAVLREYLLELPTSVVPGAGSGLVAVNGKTFSSPSLGSSVRLQWSPNGNYLAVWPQDAAFIFVVAPSLPSNQPLLRINETVALGLSGFKWTPDSTGLLVSLFSGMGIKHWRLDCKHAVHLFPYPKFTAEGIDFSADGQFMAILHRRDYVDHIAVYGRVSDGEDGDWQVIHWLNVPEHVNLEGISFARGSGTSTDSEIPFLYAWESLSKFHFLVYDSNGEIKVQVEPEDLLAGVTAGEVDAFDKAFCTFGIRKWQWCHSGRLAVFSDSQENVYLWNAVIHKLMGQISLHLDVLKQQNPIVFREQPIHDQTTGQDRVKYEASYAFPLQSQILAPTIRTGEEFLNYGLSRDGEFLALHHAGKYPNCLWIFDLKAFRLKAILLQLNPITDFSWNPAVNVLSIASGSDHIYFWQPEGTHCIPYHSTEFSIRKIQWHQNRKTMLLHGDGGYCLGIPEVLSNPTPAPGVEQETF